MLLELIIQWSKRLMAKCNYNKIRLTAFGEHEKTTQVNTESASDLAPALKVDYPIQK